MSYLTKMKPICHIDGRTVLDRLQTAHGTLAMLPMQRWPQGYALNCSHLGLVLASGRQDRSAKASSLPSPTRQAISEMEEALSWLDLLPDPPSDVRTAVQMRCLTSPYTGAIHMTWIAIGELLDCSHTHARTLCLEGISIITEALGRPAKTSVPATSTWAE